MNNASQNLNFLLHETPKNNKTIITHEEIYEKVEKLSEELSHHDCAIFTEDDYENSLITLELEYNINYTKKELERIADYYSISKRKKKKSDLIEHIVIFETNEENLPLVLQRQKMWEYIKVIKADKYLSKFLILD
jgi:hypothetical protein|tara:strand:+ start:637 stop:1041 length:405 start_codon:yes stop_codon:yes gene_type:complete